MLLEDALPYLQTLIRTSYTHPDYAHCIQLRDYYHALATGENLGVYLRRYEARETEAEFAGRLRLTNFITPAIWSSLRKPFQGVARLRFGVIRRFDYAKAADADRRATALDEFVGRYYHNDSLDNYLSEELDALVLDTDPNAWLLTEFQPFDYRQQQAAPYPVVIPCQAAVDFTSQAGVHTSLTVRTSIGVKLRYTTYLADETVDAWPFLEQDGQLVSSLPAGAAADGVFTDLVGYPTHQYRILRHNTGRLPAKRVGFTPDKRTGGRTKVSYMQPATIWLSKTLKLDSEADITAAQVVHPHKAQYALPCPGLPNDICDTHGRNRDGDKCGLCGGTHINPTQTGAGDVLQLPYPQDAEAKDIVDLSKLVVWNRPPSDIIKLQHEILDSYEVKAHRAMFNSDVLVKGDIAQTASEYLSRKAEFNKALEPYAANLSALFVYTVYVIAAYTDLADGLEVVHELPDALLPLTKEQLISLRKLSMEADAPAGELEEIDLDIARQRYKNDPEAFLRFQLRQRIAPFTGQTNEEVLKLYALQLVSVDYMVRRVYVDSLIADITAKEKGPQWLYWTQEKQDARITEEVQVIMAQLPVSSTPVSSLFSGFTPARATAVTE